MITKIGLDLGYANITLSNVTSEVYREPSVALVDRNTRKIVSVGNQAAISECGANELLVRPFKNGLLYSSDLTEDIISNVIKSIGRTDKIKCIIALPSTFNSKQHTEIFNMLERAGVEECFSVSPAMAAVIGAGYTPNISAISVNIGASSTELLVLHKGKIISSVRFSSGGENFDKAVKQYVYDQGDVTISLLIARTLKERLGAVFQGRESDSVDIEGTLALTGNRVKMSIATEDLVGVFEKPLQELLMNIANVVKKIPLEIVKDVFENGIILSGGGAELFGLDIIISKVLGVNVTLAKSPIDCVAKGLARIHSFLPERSRVNAKDITSALSKYYESKNKN